MARKQDNAERDAARERLRAIFPPGSVAHTVLRHCSRSGLSRSISVLAMDADGPRDVTYLVARAVGLPVDDRRGGVKVGGCGMDMGFHLVYEMAARLYPDGFTCTGERCPSNAHSNGDRDYTPHHHTSGGYALRHRWL